MDCCILLQPVAGSAAQPNKVCSAWSGSFTSGSSLASCIESITGELSRCLEDRYANPSPQPVFQYENKEPAGNGTLLGPNATYVKLISVDKVEFIIMKAHAKMSPLIKSMLQSLEAELPEGEENRITLGFNNVCLSRICKYLEYKYYNLKVVPHLPLADRCPFEFELSEAFDLLSAGHILHL